MAKPAEAAILSDLCLRSKAAWGYDREFIEACRDELTLSPADIISTRVQVAVIGGRIAGVVQIKPRGAVAELAKLFVEPTALRSGVGQRLFEWATAAAVAGGAVMLLIEADPNAAAFYRRMGAIDDGVAPSGSIPGRFIPRLLLPLRADDPQSMLTTGHSSD